jgi:hypothetical protein
MRSVSTPFAHNPVSVLYPYSSKLRLKLCSLPRYPLIIGNLEVLNSKTIQMESAVEDPTKIPRTSQTQNVFDLYLWQTKVHQLVGDNAITNLALDACIDSPDAWFYFSTCNIDTFYILAHWAFNFMHYTYQLRTSHLKRFKAPNGLPWTTRWSARDIRWYWSGDTVRQS